MNNESIIEKLAQYDIRLAKLEADYQATQHRKSPLVEECIARARSDFDAAIIKLAEQDALNCKNLIKAADIYTSFGNKIMEAEAIEYFLGEGEFLELDFKYDADWELRFERLISTLEKEILYLRLHIQKQGTKTNESL